MTDQFTNGGKYGYIPHSEHIYNTSKINNAYKYSNVLQMNVKSTNTFRVMYSIGNIVHQQHSYSATMICYFNQFYWLYISFI